MVQDDLHQVVWVWGPVKGLDWVWDHPVALAWVWGWVPGWDHRKVWVLGQVWGQVWGLDLDRVLASVIRPIRLARSLLVRVAASD
jgi:hypothetical protein